MSRIAFDTNVLAYISGVDRHASDGPKIDAARLLLSRLRGRATLIAPVQVLGELYVILTRAGASRDEARDAVLRIHRAFGSADSGSSAFLSALDLACAHKLQLWDSLILNAAAEAGCMMLLSEDMQSGFSWRGTLILNPFADPVDSRLLALFA